MLVEFGPVPFGPIAPEQQSAAASSAPGQLSGGTYVEQGVTAGA